MKIFGKLRNKKTMKFSTRILISFIAISIIPIIIILVAYNLTTSYSLTQYGIDGLKSEGIYNNAFLISKLTKEEIKELSDIAKTDSKKLEDPGFLEEFNEKLEDKDSFLVIRKREEMYFNGSADFKDSKIAGILPEYGEEISGDDDWINIRTNDHLLIKQIDFRFDDGNEGSAFIISNMNRLYPGLKRMIRDLIVIGIFVLIVTALCMTLWIYMGVSKPVKKLKKATQDIRDGNLDFTVDGTESVKEINELCSDFEEMRKRLKESQEEKMNFDSENKVLIRNISHDLKTPITAVKGYCEGIMDGVADTPEKMDKYIRTIYNKANEMDRLINELTFYSKIDTNRMPYTFAKLDVKEFFSDCADELELELERERVAFRYVNTLKDHILIIADAEQLRRVIHNIVNNSVKYMDKPVKWIELRIHDAGDFIQVDIEDNGKGIAKKDLSRVFDRFYRTDASRNSTRGGSGIGLSIVRKILEDHGGKVWAGGEEGVGTVISFILRKYQEVSFSEQDTYN